MSAARTLPEVVFSCASNRWKDMTADAKSLDRLAFTTQSRFGRVDPDAHLCAMQRQQAREGFVQAAISTNIYGFCVRDTLNDGHGVLHSARNGGGALAAVEFAKAWHAADPERREVIIGYVNAAQRSELDAALALAEAA